jgi:spore coat polysaccharide biosynthesis predicted glycosyltransferase SpsG/RimJ/RimL family protein N-acetyltransferase
MIPATVAFRCDGDDRIGAGHVARCLQLAKAFAAGGAEVVFAGSFGGVARTLVAEAGFPTAQAMASGTTAGAAAVVVDSYEITDAEIERMSRRQPTAVICDGPRAPRATAALSYHLDPLDVDGGTIAVAGVDYAPVAPGFVAARRNRGLERALVTMGGGSAGGEARREAVLALRELGSLEIFVATAEPVADDIAGPDLSQGTVRGLDDRAAWADVAVAAGGTTAYDLACAGVPAVLVALADNQRPIVRTLGQAGVAIAGAGGTSGLRAAAGALADAGVRAEVAAAGPALVDGYGSFRARDAIAAALAGSPLPPVLRYRPATTGDADLLLAWRNDESVRHWSRSTEAIEEAQHQRWLRRTLDSPLERTLFVVERDGRPVGTVRFDHATDHAEISVTIAPAARGTGVGARAIRESSELALAAFPGVHAVTAAVHEDNAGSLRAFARAGFRDAEPAGDRTPWRSLAIDRALVRTAR